MELIRTIDGHEDKITVQGPRGRPRPLETIQRDERVLSLVRAEPRSGNELWEMLGREKVSRPQVWLCLDRLRRRGLIRLDKNCNLWTASGDSPCP